MKISLFLISLILFLPFYNPAQSFYNGSFETTTLSVCSMSLADSNFNGQMPHVRAYGAKNMYNNIYLPYYGQICVQDSGCFIQPQHGKWCLGLRSSFGPASDAISMELDSPLDSGSTYYLSFYLYGNRGFRNFECDLYIGESIYDSIFGTPVYTVTPTYLSWKNVSFSFVASGSSKYITAKTLEGYDSWNQIDNFIISTAPIPLAIKEIDFNDFFVAYPNPANTQLKLKFSEMPLNLFAEVYDLYGKPTLLKQPIHFSETDLDVGELAPGLYTLRISDGLNSSCKKFVVDR